MNMTPTSLVTLALAATLALSSTACSETDSASTSAAAQSAQRASNTQPAIATPSLLTDADAAGVLIQYWKQQGSMRAKQEAEFGISITNKTTHELSGAGSNPVYVTYYWLDQNGAPLIWENQHTPLPAPILPNGAGAVTFKVTAPEMEGKYTLEVAVGQEGGLALREHGQQPLRYGVNVTRN